MAQDAGESEPLFAGVTFWLSATVPSKQMIIEKIKANGGSVTPVETRATVKIADHVRPKHAPPGSLSYTFIEASVRDAELADLDTHRIGPANPRSRPVADMTQPIKTTRVPFTAQDDASLLVFIQANASSSGENSLSGNELYKNLERINPRHPWQSWRDRYVKRFKNQSITLNTTELDLPTHRHSEAASEIKPAVAQPSPTSTNEPIEELARVTGIASTVAVVVPTRISQRARKRLLFEGPEDGEASQDVQNLRKSTRAIEPTFVPGSVVFTGDDYKVLFDGAEEIFEVDPELYETAWKALATNLSRHTAEEWKYLWESKVRSDYLALREREQLYGESSTNEESDGDEDAESGSQFEEVSQSQHSYDKSDTSDVELSEVSASNFQEIPQSSQPAPSDTVSEGDDEDTGQSSQKCLHALDNESSGSGPRKRPRLRETETSHSAMDHGSYHETLYVTVPSSREVGLTAMNGESSVSGDSEGTGTSASGNAVYYDRYGREHRASSKGSVNDGDGQESDVQNATEDGSDDHTLHLGTDSLDTQSQDAALQSQRELYDSISRTVEFGAITLPRKESKMIDDVDDARIVASRSIGQVQDGESEDETGSVTKIDRIPSRTEEKGKRAVQTAFESVESDSGQSKYSPLPSVNSKREFNPAALRNASPPLPITSQPSILNNLLLSQMTDPNPENVDGDEDLSSTPRKIEQDATLVSESAELFEKEFVQWEEAHLEAGVSQDIVDQAVKATGGNIWIADTVVRCIQAGLGVPRGIRGIWTDADDRALREGQQNKELLQTLTDKHGEQACVERYEFLQAHAGQP